jgi:hypothetical protein
MAGNHPERANLSHLLSRFFDLFTNKSTPLTVLAVSLSPSQFAAVSKLFSRLEILLAIIDFLCLSSRYAGSKKFSQCSSDDEKILIEADVFYCELLVFVLVVVRRVNRISRKRSSISVKFMQIVGESAKCLGSSTKALESVPKVL